MTEVTSLSPPMIIKNKVFAIGAGIVLIAAVYTLVMHAFDM